MTRITRLAALTLLLCLLPLSMPAAAREPADIRDIRDFNLEQYRGKVLYLDFWASWCKPCQKSFPWMNRLQGKFPADRFEVVTINLDSDRKPMLRFLERIPADFTIYHDASGHTAEKFKLPGMPTSYLIDQNGKPVSRHIGFFTDKTARIEEEIRNLIEKQP